MKKLNRDFYNRNSVCVARELIGKYLVHTVDNIRIAARIVETEAYMGPSDKAAHSYNNKRTKRTEVMFGPPGFAYVFLIYGMYSCMNIVTAEAGKPQAVLIRALEPVEGLEKMAKLRYGKALSSLKKSEMLGLTNGPGKLCISMGITTANNGNDLCSDNFFVSQNKVEEEIEITTTTRVNIDYAEEAINFPWRFYISNNKYVSKK